MKKNNKVNPLKYFNDNKAMAYKKAGGAMKDFKKSLKRYQGDVTGSQVSSDARNAAMDSANKINMVNEQYNSGLINSRKLMEDTYNTQNLLRDASERNRLFDNMQTRNNQAAQATMRQKKGGSVKRKKK
jgi:hypothetical protein